MHGVIRTDGPLGRQLGWKGNGSDLDVVSAAELRRRRQGEVERRLALERERERQRARQRQAEAELAVLRERLVVTYAGAKSAPAFTMAELIGIAADAFGIAPHALKSPRRQWRLVHARQTAMWLCREFAEGAYGAPSLTQIGRHIGGRDHTTILHGLNKVDAVVRQYGLTAFRPHEWARLLSELPLKAWKVAS